MPDAPFGAADTASDNGHYVILRSIVSDMRIAPPPAAASRHGGTALAIVPAGRSLLARDHGASRSSNRLSSRRSRSSGESRPVIAVSPRPGRRRRMRTRSGHLGTPSRDGEWGFRGSSLVHGHEPPASQGLRTPPSRVHGGPDRGGFRQEASVLRPVERIRPTAEVLKVGSSCGPSVRVRSIGRIAPVPIPAPACRGPGGAGLERVTCSARRVEGRATPPSWPFGSTPKNVLYSASDRDGLRAGVN